MEAYTRQASEFRGTAGTLLYVQKSVAFLMLTSHAGFSHCQTRTRSFVTYNEKRYNISDGLSTRVHELAFGIVICFGSAEFLYIYAILYIDASIHSPTTVDASASPTALLVSF